MIIRNIKRMKEKKEDKYTFKLVEGRVNILINDLLHINFNRKDYKGLASHKFDNGFYGIDIYIKGSEYMKIEYWKRETWENILKLIQDNL